MIDQLDKIFEEEESRNPTPFPTPPIPYQEWMFGLGLGDIC